MARSTSRRMPLPTKLRYSCGVCPGSPFRSSATSHAAARSPSVSSSVPSRSKITSFIIVFAFCLSRAALFRRNFPVASFSCRRSRFFRLGPSGCFIILYVGSFLVNFPRRTRSCFTTHPSQLSMQSFPDRVSDLARTVPVGRPVGQDRGALSARRRRPSGAMYSAPGFDSGSDLSFRAAVRGVSPCRMFQAVRSGFIPGCSPCASVCKSRTVPFRSVASGHSLRSPLGLAVCLRASPEVSSSLAGAICDFPTGA